MKKKLSEQSVQIINRLSRGELAELDNHIEKEYGIVLEGSGMLRDDIRDIVIELLYRDFSFLENIDESQKLIKLAIDPTDATAFSDTLVEEFSLDEIEFSDIMRWETVADIIQTVDEMLEKPYKMAIRKKEDNGR